MTLIEGGPNVKILCTELRLPSGVVKLRHQMILLG
jgi:hypothetical protein